MFSVSVTVKMTLRASLVVGLALIATSAPRAVRASVEPRAEAELSTRSDQDGPLCPGPAVCSMALGCSCRESGGDPGVIVEAAPDWRPEAGSGSRGADEEDETYSHGRGSPAAPGPFLNAASGGTVPEPLGPSPAHPRPLFLLCGRLTC